MQNLRCSIEGPSAGSSRFRPGKVPHMLWGLKAKAEELDSKRCNSVHANSSEVQKVSGSLKYANTLANCMNGEGIVPIMGSNTANAKE